jgi:hypothetical protein
MKKIVFTNVTTEQHDYSSKWQIKSPKQFTEPGPYQVIVPDHVDPKMAAQGFFGQDVVDYQCQIIES